jgi:hypothetical protein
VKLNAVEEFDDAIVLATVVVLEETMLFEDTGPLAGLLEDVVAEDVVEDEDITVEYDAGAILDNVANVLFLVLVVEETFRSSHGIETLKNPRPEGIHTEPTTLR